MLYRKRIRKGLAFIWVVVTLLGSGPGWADWKQDWERTLEQA